jgi:cold shock CspA family protein
MRGTMLWFNDEQDHGVIEAADGERLQVGGAEFAAGIRPVGRCRGTAVDFSVVEGDERHAAAVSFVPEAAQRRARRHSRHTYSK